MLDLTKWLAIAMDNLLFFGSGKTLQLVQLRRVDLPNAHNFTYKFRKVDDSVIRISYDKTLLNVEVNSELLLFI